MLSSSRSRVPLLTTTTALALLFLMFGLATAASAQEPETRDTADGEVVDDQLPVVRVTSGRLRSVEIGGSEGTGSDGCRWRVYVTDDLTQPIFQNGVDLIDDSSPVHIPDITYHTARLFSETGRWFSATGCDSPARNGTYAEGDATSMPQLLATATASLDPPGPQTFGTSPLDNGDDRFLFVNLPTWF